MHTDATYTFSVIAQINQNNFPLKRDFIARNDEEAILRNVISTCLTLYYR